MFSGRPSVRPSVTLTPITRDAISPFVGQWTDFNERKFTKRLPGMKTLSYHQRLVKLGLESLELRRLRADLLFTYKLVFGITDFKLSD